LNTGDSGQKVIPIIVNHVTYIICLDPKNAKMWLGDGSLDHTKHKKFIK